MVHTSRKRSWRKMASLAIVAILAMALLAACGNKGYSLSFKGTGKGETVATYKDGQVTKAEFDKFLSILGATQPMYEQFMQIPGIQEMFLKQYVAFKIIGSRASDDVLKEAEEQTKEYAAQFESYKKSDASFAAALKEKKVSDADIKTYLFINTVKDVYMDKQVTAEQLNELVEASPVDYAKMTVRHVLVNTVEVDQMTGESTEVRSDDEALAIIKEAREKLLGGSDWDTVAKQYSEDGGSKEKGGLYEDALGKGWVESFKKAAYEQPIGEVGEPVKSEYGYHVIQVEKREPQTYDQLPETVKTQLRSEVVYGMLEKFIEEELEAQGLTITLPEPAASSEPSESGAPEESPEAGEGSETPAAQ